MRLALAQINPTVGDIAGNTIKIRAFVDEAKAAGPQIILLPELAVCGCPPEDLLLRDDFLRDCSAAVERIAAAAHNTVICVGFPHRTPRGTFNAVAVCADGGVVAVCHKSRLGDDLFDERRYFHRGIGPACVRVGSRLVAVTVGDDLWIPDAGAIAAADLVVNMSASPYHRAKAAERLRAIAECARAGAPVACVSQVGGHDELVFDGQSVVVDGRGRTLARAVQFEEQILTVDVPSDTRRKRRAPALLLASVDLPPSPSASSDESAPGPVAATLPDLAEMYHALVLATRDYVHKSGFRRAVLGMSGGVDSALVALIAADALGPENVTCVVMPSRYSSEETQSDARQMTRNLGCRLEDIQIAPIVDAYTRSLSSLFAGLPQDTTEENIQARVRGSLLMAYSNKLGALVLTTGNKSELSVGYCTLYGDMAGGFAVLKDVPKTLVFELTRWRDRQSHGELVPAGILSRPPSAELRPGQEDTDSLPSYDTLDAILAAHVEQGLGPREIEALGHDRDVVMRVIGLVAAAEHKRRQAPPGPRVTRRSLGRDRRVPIINGYR